METNPYIKQYPDLMVDKKIMYVHGFMSSAKSGTVKLLADFLPKANIISKDLPLNPEEAVALLRDLCEKESPDLIIGSSMGGMYAEMLKGFDRILVNPAFSMGDNMSSMMGKQSFQNPREDGIQDFIVTKSMTKEYKDITTHCFENVTEEEKEHVWGMFGDNDPTVHTYDLFMEHYPQAIHFHGEHRLIDKVVHNYLIPVIRWIDDKQEERERPIVYIDYESLHDNYNKPVSCMSKAFKLLIENYKVYIVAPAPTNRHEDITNVLSWVEEYLNAPAWNNVLFTNNKNLLYGDYFIDPQPDINFMGTAIKYGSDEFKTWEEIITFFERLGGQ